MASNLQIVIDTDVGLDDALALILCLAAEVRGDAKIVGVTCVHGNTSLQNVCCNTLKTLHSTGRLDVPVYMGAEDSLVESPNNRAEGYHGLDGFGDFEYAHELDPNDYLQKEHAVTFLTRIASEKPGEITLLCLGPLTNIALAAKMDPAFCSNIKDMVIMGGNIAGIGNASLAAEFNFHCDPEAAHIVLKHMKCQITLYPWETAFNYAGIPYGWRCSVLGKVSSPQIELLNQAEAKTLKKQTAGSWVQCDQVAAAILLNPDIVTSAVKRYAMVELHGHHTRGAMVLDHYNSMKKEHNIIVVEKIDLDLYKELLLSAASTNLSNFKKQDLQ